MFKIGDVVTLKSGSFAMVVERVRPPDTSFWAYGRNDTGKIFCKYFNHKKEFVRCSHAPELLELQQ